MSNLVKNGYFLATSTPMPSLGYIYVETQSATYITDWTFPNGITTGSILSIGGIYGFLATSLPTGITQYYGIQQGGPGTIQGVTQNITFPKYGTGTLSFWISKRYGFVNLTQSITVSLGSNSRSYNKQDNLWYYETIPFTITNANDLIQTLSISATTATAVVNSQDFDQTVYISGISIDYVPFTEMVQTTEFVLNGDIVSPKLLSPTSITAPKNWSSVGTCSVSEFYDGGYLTFNGINQYGALDLSASYAYPNGTVECRFRTIANLPSSNQTLVAKQSAYALFVSANTLVAYIFGSGQVLATGILVNDGNWHHVAFSFQSNVTDGSKLYLDGVLVKTATCSITDQTGAYRIGALTYGEYFNGSLDDVRIWTSVLSDEQIIRNYNSKTVSNTSTGLTGYWRLDEASGTTATNSFSGGVNFTLYNNPTFTPIPSTPVTSVGLPKTLTQYVNIINNGSVLYQYINLVTEGNFILSFWANTSTTSLTLTVAIEPLVFTTFTIDNVWRQYTFNFTVLKYQINQLLRFQISSNFTARLTGISIRQLPVLYYIQTPDLVQNGNMTSLSAVTGFSSNKVPTSWWKSNANTGLVQRSSKVTTGLPSTIPQLVVLSITSDLVSGELYQSITFNTIGNYVLSFWMGQNPEESVPFNANQAINVSLGTILTNSTTYASKSDPWKQVILPFTISSPNTTATLKFTMTGSANGQQVYLSGVSIIASSMTNGNFDSPVVTATTTYTTTSSTNIMNWTGSGSNGWGQGNFTNPVTNNTYLSSSILQYAYINKDAYLSQTNTFSAAGNYTLTFWASSANASITASPSVSLKVDIGTGGAIFSKTFDYISNTTWTRYSVSFSVVSGSLTQPLKFTNSSLLPNTTQIRLTGISITDAVQTINAGSGNITTTGLLTAGNINTTGTLSAGTVSSTGALSAGSVSTTGALNAGSVTSTGGLSVGTVTSTGALTAGTVTSTGALTAGSVTTTGTLTAKNICFTENSTSGLSFRVYKGYHGNNAAFLDNNNTYYTSGTGGSVNNFGRSSDFTSIASATNNYISNSGSEDFFSVLWTGYFKPDVTGTWTFRLQSDDNTYIWLGNQATSAYTIANCDLKDTADAAVPSKTFTLTAGVYYPIRIQYGEIAGGVGLILYMTGPFYSVAYTEKTNGTGLFFSDVVNSSGNIYTNGDINTTKNITTNQLITNQLITNQLTTTGALTAGTVSSTGALSAGRITTTGSVTTNSLIFSPDQTFLYVPWKNCEYTFTTANAAASNSFGDAITAVTTAPKPGQGSNINYRYSVIGNTMYLQFTYSNSSGNLGTAGTGKYFFNIPPGYNIQSSFAHDLTSNPIGSCFGSGYNYYGSVILLIHPMYYDATKLVIWTGGSVAGSGYYTQGGDAAGFNVVYRESWEACFPISKV